ncbi:ATP-binding protein, partial [Pseudoalteromonas carrageenovora]
EMPNDLTESLLSELKGKEFIDVKTIHKDADCDAVLFDLDEESDCTQKLFSFAGPWIDSLEH